MHLPYGNELAFQISNKRIRDVYLSQC